MQQARIATNHIYLNVVRAGPSSGPLVILLHGFPEFWFGWRHQIEPLAGEGLQVWAPDQRGYNLSDKPRGIAAYNLDQLAADVIGLIDAAGRTTAFLVGHDWGAAVAWYVAAQFPERLNKLVILNVPHPSVMLKTVRTRPKQMLKSWYIVFFQIPRAPELLARAGHWRALVETMERSSRPGSFTGADFERYREAWSRPEAMTSMLNWYRAIVQKPPRPLPDPRIHVPTLIIWGVHDVALSQEMAPASAQLCDKGRLELLGRATHWVQHDEPDRVNELMIQFLRE
ncbi:MAG: alpha/beta hydrolase [Chloroflexi bacterium]|nr:alpha/beta hydrolase [Chloroflexota bacterium]